jgi:hypothetical protein
LLTSTQPGNDAALARVVIAMSERSLGGYAVTGNERPSRSFAKNRVCDEPGCSTRLSIYNNGKYCYPHEPMAVPRTRGRKVA